MRDLIQRLKCLFGFHSWEPTYGSTWNMKAERCETCSKLQLTIGVIEID